MKKKLSLLITMLLVLSMLFGCAASTGSADDAAANDAASDTANDAATDAAEDGAGDEAPAEKYKVGIALNNMNEYWTNAVNAYQLAVDTNYPNIELVSPVVCDNDPQKQLEQVEGLVNSGISALIICVNEASLAPEIVKITGDIPVIWTNRVPDKVELGGIYTYVGSDDSVPGVLQAEYITELMKEQGKTELDYVIMMGQLGKENTRLRTEGNQNTLAESGLNVNEVMVDYADHDRTKSMDKITTLIGSGKEFDVVFCNSDDMALGAVEACKAAGIQDDVMFCGIDGTINALQSIKAGEQTMTCLQYVVDLGETTVKAAWDAIQGESLEPELMIDYIVVDAENVDEWIEKVEAATK